jgi:hypothetical protein
MTGSTYMNDFEDNDEDEPRRYEHTHVWPDVPKEATLWAWEDRVDEDDPDDERAMSRSIDLEVARAIAEEMGSDLKASPDVTTVVNLWSEGAVDDCWTIVHGWEPTQAPDDVVKLVETLIHEVIESCDAGELEEGIANLGYEVETIDDYGWMEPEDARVSNLAEMLARRVVQTRWRLRHLAGIVRVDFDAWLRVAGNPELVVKAVRRQGGLPLNQPDWKS